MNNKIKNSITLFCIFILITFSIYIFLNKDSSKSAEITDIKILNYIPENSKFTLITNYQDKDIRKFIDKNISDSKKKEFNINKNAIFAYLGIDLQKEIIDIYDGEFLLSFFDNELGKKDILLIFKIKENTNINDIFNLGDELNKSDEIIGLKREGKLNYLSHFYQTNDKYIITSSDKLFIKNSLKEYNNNKPLKETILHNLNEKQNHIFSISNSKYPNLNNKYNQIYKFITTYTFENNKIKMRSFLLNQDELNSKNSHNKFIDVKDIIYSNQLFKYIEKLDFIFGDNTENELLAELAKIITKPTFFVTNNNNWVMSFANKFSQNISLNQLKSLQNFNKNEINNDDIIYTVYTKDILEKYNNEISYKQSKPIFTLKDSDFSYISNDFEDLLKIRKQIDLSESFKSNYKDELSHKYIINDKLFVKLIKNKQLIEYFSFFKYLKYFINNDRFLSLENNNLTITQKIPEASETINLESDLNIF